MRSWLALTGVVTTACWAAAAVLDERPAVEGDWGYRPEDGTTAEANPPAFSWRPSPETATYELECARDAGFADVEYRAAGVGFNVHAPPRVLPPGRYLWRYRGVDKAGTPTAWSQVRRFELPTAAPAMPLPPRAELLGRIPRTHPRLFVRPEQLADLRARAQGEMQPRFAALVTACDKWLANPPPTAEPPTYPDGMERKSEAWAKIWWGNRTYTVAALDSAATLAFTRLLGGKDEYGQLAKRILLDCAKWDPKGSTGYRYNDEAGMPFAWGFARTYTFVYDLLSEEERQTCRQVMKVRGEEMYRHLCPGHLWRPYNSHSNRAWHKLGEVGIAFLGEIPEAEDWVWFAMNVFACTYPVWSDADGGWHEGNSYWSSYMDRFSFWADIMKTAMGVDAYDKPFFSKVGYYPMYLMPPGTVGGGFGDLTPDRKAKDNLSLMSNFAAQAGNGHWAWYVKQLGGPAAKSGYIGFVRGLLPAVPEVPPDDLATSRLFRGTGQAYLNTSLRDAAQNVQVLFKSSPFGTQSHGYEANNAFAVSAFGQRLLVQTGRRDIYGSDHHRLWMWSTRSTNSITVNGQGQVAHSATSRGEVVAFETTPLLDAVVGEAGAAYRVPVPGADGKPVGGKRLLDRFTRTVVFAKPDLVLVYDRLAAVEPARFEYWLHAVNRFDTPDLHHLRTQTGEAVLDLDLALPAAGLTVTQTDQYDPNPRERIKVREWHLTAATPEASPRAEFLLVCQPRRASAPALPKAVVTPLPGGYLLRQTLPDGEVLALLPGTGTDTLTAEGLSTAGGVTVQVRRNGQAVATLRLAR